MVSHFQYVFPTLLELISYWNNLKSHYNKQTLAVQEKKNNTGALVTQDTFSIHQIKSKHMHYYSPFMASEYTQIPSFNTEIISSKDQI